MEAVHQFPIPNREQLQTGVNLIAAFNCFLEAVWRVLIRANSCNSWPVNSKNRHEFHEKDHLTVAPKKFDFLIAPPGFRLLSKPPTIKTLAILTALLFLSTFRAYPPRDEAVQRL